ncbi:glycosyltransferase family 4 protein [Bacteroides sp.]|uniref:glycosyltransferase family 4 protein n=1 Tax=Bacteroides sp. TaxID=29523 RepID=UPI002FC73ACA
MKKEMHVLILPMYYPEKDSSPHRGYMFYEQATQIVQNGCKVGLAFVEQRPTRNFSWKKFCKESHFQISSEDNGLFTVMRMHAWNPKLSTHIGGLIWTFLTLLLVRRYIRKQGKPDLIHAHFGCWAGYAAYLIRKIYHIDYLITEHASSINGDAVRPSQARILRKAYNHARKVICVGSLLGRNLQRYIDYPEKITVIPNFVDTQTFRWSGHITDKEVRFVFVSVGNLSKRKGFTELIEAFEQSFGNLPHVSLLIIGDGEEKVNLQQTINRLEMQKQITLTGRLSREALATQLDSADAFVLASYAETFGIVVIEAMAAGLPSIGTICGGPEDIITPESGFLIEPGDTKELGKKMLELYHTYERFDKEQIRRSIVNRFDFRLAGKLLTDLYRQLVTS